MVPARKNDRNWLPGIFNEFFGNEWLERSRSAVPAVNIKENERGFCVEVAAPGMTWDDFRVDITPDNELVVSVEKRDEKRDDENPDKCTYLRREFSYSRFQQTLLLPDNVEKEKITAKVENGVMTIEIPKMKEAEKAAESRRIEVM